ncbi:hypothetical protein GCM10022279_17830 [Comamonas faecalis]|uniref:Replication-associated protein G2P N-terminal domain-containing protein n=1 Tax=Comamonas faecalis TaxID=1387849 RepID=A0ABP7RAB5_9BURK
MAYDTVKLRSPYIDESLMQRIEQQCVLRSGLDLASGQILYELHTGELLGSWDSRISVKPMREEFVSDKNGRTALHPCEPYLFIEASVHKIRLGHNVYGGPTDFLAACRDFVALVEELLGTDLPVADWWTVHRVDVANVFALPPAEVGRFFDSMQLLSFPRRSKKAMKTKQSCYFPGKTTTVKFYHKGPEFQVHDAGRLKRFFRQVFTAIHGVDAQNHERAEKRVAALQRLADNRLRVEVEIHSDKFQYDFGRNPRVSEVTDDYLNGVHDSEIERILREGKQGMETVRTEEAVWQRLHAHHPARLAHVLHAFWQVMAVRGDEKTRERYTKATFYRNRKLLEASGISWRGSDLVIVANDAIQDFAPLRVDRRFCCAPARNRPEYLSSRDLMRLAA